jgi:hypothetical protein
MFAEGGRKSLIHGYGFPMPSRDRERLVEAKFGIGRLGMTTRNTFLDKIMYKLHMDDQYKEHCK